VDDPPATVARMAERIRPGGMMASLEFGVPGGAALPAWRLWTRAGLPLFGAPGGRAWIATGRFLGPSIERFWREHPLEEVLGWWAAAGMEGIRARRLSLGGGVIVWGTRSGWPLGGDGRRQLLGGRRVAASEAAVRGDLVVAHPLERRRVEMQRDRRARSAVSHVADPGGDGGE